MTAANAIPPMLDLWMPWVATAVPMAPMVAEAAKAASRLVNQASARFARVVSRSVVGRASASSGFSAGGNRGDNPANRTAIRADTSNRPKDASVASEPMAGTGAAVIAPTSVAAATTTAQHATAVNVIPPQPVMRIASTDVAAAAIAATSTLWTPGTPGTASRPATAPNMVAITLNVRPAIGSRYVRHAITANSKAAKPAAATTPAVASE